MSAMFSSGDRFGGSFILLRPLGSGGMADVWLAREDDLGREVALKILHRAADAARDSFLSEAKSLAAVRHPGVVPILRFGVDEATDHPFFAMPVYSETLANRLDREGRLAENKVAELGMSLVPALAALHAAGIAHRDLKPSNVLLDEQGTPVLADIGPMGGGTPAWAAPEQFSGKKDHSSFVICHSSFVPDGGAAADWHALGLLLYRALVGTLPPPRGILPAAVEPPRGTLPRDLHPRPSRGWEQLLVALLDPDPATRLTDADAILRALHRLRRRAHRRICLKRGRRGVLLMLAVAAVVIVIGVAMSLLINGLNSGTRGQTSESNRPRNATSEVLRDDSEKTHGDDPTATAGDEPNFFKSRREQLRAEQEERIRRIFEESEENTVPEWILRAQAEQTMRQMTSPPAKIRPRTAEEINASLEERRLDRERAFREAQKLLSAPD